ncbi:MAG: hypothetical protein IJD45_04320 [Clostridia bacterium]|nr:hypothetical protein [Clostridia bacterium]
MKKLFCIILCLVLCFSLSACGEKDKDKSSNAADLEYYARIGRIPEVDYVLGTDVDKITAELNKRLEEENKKHQEDPNHTHDHDEDEFFFEVFEGEKNVLLDNGYISYYYTKANKDKGVSYIVNYDTAYGFPLGTVISEIKAAYPDFEFIEQPLDANNAFFADYIMDGTVLSTPFDGNVISFVFQNNELFATAIFNDNWSK